MPALINMTQNVNPLDHTTVAIELTVREVAHLQRLLGCTGQDVTEELGLYHSNDDRVAGLYSFLCSVVEEAPVDLDEFVGPLLVVGESAAS